MKPGSLIKYVGIFLCVLLTAGCATQPGQQQVWPEQLPAQSYFEQIYSADLANQAVQTKEDYLKWIKRFYLGWALYPNGWQWLTDSVLKETDDYQLRLSIKQQMASVGERIGAEWAKDSAHRSINTGHLAVWGNAMKLAIKHNSQQQYVKQVSSDVDALLSTTLSPSDINIERYFPEQNTVAVQDALQDDPFDS